MTRWTGSKANMTDENNYIGSKKDMKRFASWCKTELLNSLNEKEDGGKISHREKFGLESLSEGHYKVGSDNLSASVEVISTTRMPVIRKLLKIDKEKLAGCLEEFASKSDDRDAIEKLRTSVEWLSAVRETKAMEF
jgi:hypothetical protein